MTKLLYSFALKVVLVFIALFATSNAYSKKIRVLFIGNSYTDFHNMPQIVADMAASTGETLEFDVSAYGGASFFNHASVSSSSYIHTLTKLRKGGWDYVVLQEQSVNPATPPAQFNLWTVPYAKELVDTAKYYSPCCEVVFYMTWGRKNGFPDQCGNPNWPHYCTYQSMDSVIRERYIELAYTNVAAIAPVGPVWRYVRTHYPEIELYDPDESHPSIEGAYTAACTFYAAFFRRPATGIRFDHSLETKKAADIKEAVTRVVYDSMSYWRNGAFRTIADFDYQWNVSNYTVTFTNHSVNASLYRWTFGDGSVSLASNPVHSYSATGNFTVQLVAIGDNQCADTSYTSIHIYSLPFSVSPNPASNQVFVRSPLFKNDKYVLRLFNSLGQLVLKQESDGAEVQLIKTSQLSNGFYFLQIVKGNERVHTSSIVIGRN